MNLTTLKKDDASNIIGIPLFSTEKDCSRRLELVREIAKKELDSQKIKGDEYRINYNFSDTKSIDRAVELFQDYEKIPQGSIYFRQGIIEDSSREKFPTLNVALKYSDSTNIYGGRDLELNGFFHFFLSNGEPMIRIVDPNISLWPNGKGKLYMDFNTQSRYFTDSSEIDIPFTRKDIKQTLNESLDNILEGQNIIEVRNGKEWTDEKTLLKPNKNLIIDTICDYLGLEKEQKIIGAFDRIIQRIPYTN